MEELSDRYESGKLAGFFIGALVGAGIALLFAPQAGAQLRELLRDAAGNAKDTLKEATNHGAEIVESAVAQGQEFVDKGKESLREAGRQAEEFGAEGRKAFHQTKEELRRNVGNRM